MACSFLSPTFSLNNKIEGKYMPSALKSLIYKAVHHLLLKHNAFLVYSILKITRSVNMFFQIFSISHLTTFILLQITKRGKTYAPAKKSCRKINFCYLSIHNLDSIRNVCPVFCTFYSSFSHITLNSISIFFQSLTLNHLAF